LGNEVILEGIKEEKRFFGRGKREERKMGEKGKS